MYVSFVSARLHACMLGERMPPMAALLNPATLKGSHMISRDHDLSINPPAPCGAGIVIVVRAAERIDVTCLQN